MESSPGRQVEESNVGKGENMYSSMDIINHDILKELQIVGYDKNVGPTKGGMVENEVGN